MAQDRAAVRALDDAFLGQRVEIAAQGRQRDVQRLGQLLQRHCAVMMEEFRDALPAQRRQQRHAVGIRQVIVMRDQFHDSSLFHSPRTIQKTAAQSDTPLIERETF